ncbi:hypothetical protein PM082_024023 [Marasmius tenuissimus]|nr:hypothetical protein PM082_024023 [Marasmius tenuissimus]
MPHKRAKRSVREQKKAESENLEEDMTPMPVTRVLGALKVWDEYRKLKTEDENGDEDTGGNGDGRQGKRRRKTSEGCWRRRREKRAIRGIFA